MFDEPLCALARGVSTFADMPKTPVILIVDDDITDVELARSVLSNVHVHHTVETCTDGREALARIQRAGPYENLPKPALVLLDLSVPSLSGLELLQHVKSDPSTRDVPIVVLSGTEDVALIRQAQAAHANAFIRKPGDLGAINAALCACVEFWLSYAIAPVD